MLILGVNAYHGDVAAALVQDGRLIAAVEEERFRRVKHWAGFPTLAIRECLRIAGATGADVEHVAISRDPKAHLLRKVGYAIRRRPQLSLVLDRVRNARQLTTMESSLADALSITEQRLPRIHSVEHHPAHLASAFLVSPYEEAAVCAIDGFGDFVSTSLAVGRGNRVEVLDRVFFPHSLGMLYTAVTQYLGFTSYGDEFKVMGLAPYGSPAFVDELRQLVRLKPGGRFELDLRYFRHWREGVAMEWREGYPTLGPVYSTEMAHLIGPRRQGDEEVTTRHEDLAHSLQVVYEEAALHILTALYERTGLDRLCLAGGCAMNSVANGKIRSRTPFREIFVQPAAGDNGTALGAAFHVWNDVLDRPRSFVMQHGYWGTAHPDVDVDALLGAREQGEWAFEVETHDSEEALCRAVARLIADGKIVGWYQGRMEWGARALGNRSILGDPRNPEMRDRINSKIKFREKFRPFAPSVAESALDDYFVGAAPDPFMQQVYPIREDKRAVIPAVTHVDGTGRLQTVSDSTNPRYHRLIREFEAITGVPILLNTSFNENEPIVDTPQQALDCFLRTQMDVIVLNQTVIHRRRLSAPQGATR